jgi:hypothetical protein
VLEQDIKATLRIIVYLPKIDKMHQLADVGNIEEVTPYYPNGPIEREQAHLILRCFHINPKLVL